MPHIALVKDTDGKDASLEDSLGLSTAATTSLPPTFSPTNVRGSVAIVPGPLPSDPTVGTIAIDSNDGNTLKWWTGSRWAIAGPRP